MRCFPLSWNGYLRLRYSFKRLQAFTIVSSLSITFAIVSLIFNDEETDVYNKQVHLEVNNGNTPSTLTLDVEVVLVGLDSEPAILSPVFTP